MKRFKIFFSIYFIFLLKVHATDFDLNPNVQKAYSDIFKLKINLVKNTKNKLILTLVFIITHIGKFI